MTRAGYQTHLDWALHPGVVYLARCAITGDCKVGATCDGVATLTPPHPSPRP